MSEQSVRARITSMLGEINGVRTSFANIPGALQDAQLPAFVVFAGPATYDTGITGEQDVMEDRIYNLILYVQNAAFDSTGQTELAADPFFVNVRDYVLARPGLELDSEGPSGQSESVFDTELLGDSGLTIGPYPLGGTNQYIQIRWQLRIKEIASIAYND